MLLKLFLIVVIVCVCINAFQPSLTRFSSKSISSRSLKMEDEAAPWLGAKKFSFKDRETKTVMDNVAIAKILPHRYPFLLLSP